MMAPSSAVVGIADVLPSVGSDPFAIASVLSHCPYCKLELTGSVFASFIDGQVVAVSHTRRIGKKDYTWTHGPHGCHVPALRSVCPRL